MQFIGGQWVDTNPQPQYIGNQWVSPQNSIYVGNQWLYRNPPQQQAAPAAPTVDPSAGAAFNNYAGYTAPSLGTNFGPGAAASTSNPQWVIDALNNANAPSSQSMLTQLLAGAAPAAAANNPFSTFNNYQPPQMNFGGGSGGPAMQAGGLEAIGRFFQGAGISGGQWRTTPSTNVIA